MDTVDDRQQKFDIKLTVTKATATEIFRLASSLSAVPSY